MSGRVSLCFLFPIFVTWSFFFSPPIMASYFQQVNADGFGNIHNTGGLEIKTMAVFQGMLYAGIHNQVDGAQVWRYDGKKWIKINEDGFGSKDNIAISSMTAASNKLYVGTSNRNGGQVWSYDGGEWICLHQGKFGTTLSNAISSMAVYKGKLYVGLWDQITSRPTEVWAFDGEAVWEQVNEPGFGSRYNLNTTGLEVSAVDGKEKLYALVWKSFSYRGKDAGCEVWSYDGNKWKKVNEGREGFGKKGKGRAGMEPFSIVEFKGKLYVGLWGFGAGALWEVWEYNGSDWRLANSAVKGKGKYLRLCIAMAALNDRLYAVAADGVKDFELWSFDGKDWFKIVGEHCATPDKLGDPTNKVINAMAVYNDHLYLGVTNNRSGYRIFESRFPEIHPSQKSMAVGESGLFILKGGASPVRWTSSNPGILNIDFRTGFYNARAPGTCIISATDSFGYQASPLPVAVKRGKLKKAKDNIFIFSEVTPASVTNDGVGRVLLTAQVYKTGEVKKIKKVQIDLASLHQGNQTLFDDGTHGDRIEGDHIFSFETTVPKDVVPGDYHLTVSASDKKGLRGSSTITLRVKQRYTVPEIVSVETMGKGYHIPILFDLKDLDGDTCKVTVEYKEGDGQWMPATIESKSGRLIKNPQSKYNKTPVLKRNIISRLKTPLPVNHYICVWDSENDVGKVKGIYFIRLIAEDKKSKGRQAISHPIVLDNQEPPADEMIYVPSGKFFIDKYEYPNHFGYYPKTSMTWKEARESCHERGKDLCTPEQWETAYYGLSKNSYPYGNKYGFEDRDFCNTNGSADDVPAPSGVYEHCVNDLGIYDMGGNVYEWVGLDENSVFMADQSFRGDPLLQSLINVEDPTHRHSYLGHRCCRCEQE